MHILFVTHYYEPNGGAASVHLTELTRRLQAQGHRITVLTTMPHYPKGQIADAYRGKLYQKEMRDCIEVHYAWLWATPSPRISRKLPSQLSFMFNAMLRGFAIPRPDVVYIEAQPIFTGVAGRIVSMMKRVPYIMNVSDLWPDHLLTTGSLTENHPVYRIARSVVDSGYHSAAALTTMSPLWTKKVQQYLKHDADKVKTVLLAVDTKRFQPLADVSAFREKYNLGDKKIVSFLGTFATQYDFEVIMDAAAKLQQRDDTLVLMIGTGSQREYVQQRIEAEAMPNFRLMDWLPHDEMPLAWNVSTVTFWAMHDHELFTGTLPAKLFEAMACGTPIVAAQGGEAPKILEASGGGIAVAVRDTDGLAAAIERILDDDTLRQELSAKSRAYAEREFDFDVVTRRYESILMQAANKS